SQSSPAASLPELLWKREWSHCDRSNARSLNNNSYMPLITLTTDFGTSDHFAGTMKGVILAIAPRAAIVDITHEILPYDINEAAFVIAQAWRYFPKKTIHMVVVDPGV